ncbi:hypothetical protein VIGAN_04045800, partial [Vigna angularis var. angularis]
GSNNVLLFSVCLSLCLDTQRSTKRKRKRECAVMAWCTMATCQLLTAPFKRMMELVDLGWKNNFISNHISTLIFFSIITL